MKSLNNYKIRIAGYAGTGKSFFVSKLKELGYNTIDGDYYVSLARWVDTDTGQPDDRHSGSPKEWYDHHKWFWDIKVLKEILTKNTKVVILGSADNQFNPEIGKLFDYTFYLDIPDEEILKNILREDRENDWGKEEYQFEITKRNLPEFKVSIPKDWIPLKSRDDGKLLVKEMEEAIGYRLNR